MPSTIHPFLFVRANAHRQAASLTRLPPPPDDDDDDDGEEEDAVTQTMPWASWK
jgi:hypothetical protein